MFSRKRHFLPDIIESLWRQRDEAKRQKDGARSQAIKILMNSFMAYWEAGVAPSTIHVWQALLLYAVMRLCKPPQRG